MLRTVGGYLATKQWRWVATLSEWTKVSFNAGARFHASERQVADLDALAQLLEGLRCDPRAFIVRGSLTPEVRERIEHDPEHCIPRRKHAKGSVAPSLGEADRRWLMLDIDNHPLNPLDDLADDPDLAIDAAIHELLPPAFHDADCFWQLSASAGFAAGVLKVHLFFWLAEPAPNERIKAVLKQCTAGVDLALYSAAQPHYIADPVIQGGADPLPRRMGWRRGLEQSVTLPALAPVRVPMPGGAKGAGRATGVAGGLETLGDGPGLNGFHLPLRAAIMKYAGACARSPGSRDDAAFKARLLDAIERAPKHAPRDVTQYGDAYLQRSIEGAHALAGGRDTDILSLTPHYAMPTGTLADARAAIGEHIAAFMEGAFSWHWVRYWLGNTDYTMPLPQHAGLAVVVGGGKSAGAQGALPDFIAAARASSLPHRILWLVPMHRLGNETLAKMRELGLHAAVWRGRGADLPGTGNPALGIPPDSMCLNLEAVGDARKIAANIAASVCGSDEPGAAVCPYYSECGYQRQKPGVGAADVVIASNTAMFNHLSREVSDNLALIIVDEDWWQNGIRPNIETTLADFAEVPLQHPVLHNLVVAGVDLSGLLPKVDEAATNDLHASSAKVQAVFNATPHGGFVSKASAEAVGLTVEDCSRAIWLEKRRKINDAIFPAMPADDRRKAVEDAAGNAGIARRVGIWRELVGLLSGEATHTGRLQRGADRAGARMILHHARLEVWNSPRGLEGWDQSVMQPCTW